MSSTLAKMGFTSKVDALKGDWFTYVFVTKPGRIH